MILVDHRSDFRSPATGINLWVIFQAWLYAGFPWQALQGKLPSPLVAQPEYCTLTTSFLQGILRTKSTLLASHAHMHVCILSPGASTWRSFAEALSSPLTQNFPFLSFSFSFPPTLLSIKCQSLFPSAPEQKEDFPICTACYLPLSQCCSVGKKMQRGEQNILFDLVYTVAVIE